MSAVAQPSGSAPRSSRWDRFLDRIFGTPPPPEHPPDGLPRIPGIDDPEGLYLVYALLLAIAIAVLMEFLISAAPVPPGGDPGQWISSSYPWIHSAYPSQVIFLGYPPLLFPLLGILVLLGGGAIAAGQIYVGLAAVLLGVSTYIFARSVLHRPILALLVEGFSLLNAQFMRLFFFGAYPTILALVFLCLAGACFMRWIGSYRPAYLFLAWVLLTATLLTHSLVGAVALAALGFTCLVLLLERRLPREVIVSRAGTAGLLVFLVGVGGYYLGTRLAHISHPNYLSINPLGRAKTNLSQLLYPIHLSSLPGLFGHHPYFTGAESFGVAVALTVVLFFAVAFLAARRRLPTAALLQASLILAVLAAGVVGWIFSVVTDYRRFAYLLYIPVTLAVAYVFDFLLGVFLTSRGPPAPSAPVTAGPLRGRHRPRIDGISIAAAIVGVAGLVALGVGTSVPTMAGFETEYTGPPHSQAYLDAIGVINHGRPGTVLTDNTASARWTRALTNRNVYANSEPTDFVFYGSQIEDDELALFAFSNLYGVTQGGVTSATIPSLNASGFAAAPQYNAYREGLSLPVFSVLPGSLQVSYVHDGTHVSYNAYQRLTPPTFRFLAPNRSVFSLVYPTPAGNLTEIVGPHPPANGFTINFSINATPGYGLKAINGNVISLLGPTGLHRGYGTLNWQFHSYGLTSGGSFFTNLTVQGPAGLTFSSGLNRSSGSAGGVSFNVTVGKNGTPVDALSVQLNATTPGANNLIPSLPPVLSGPGILAQWSAAYVLLDHNGSLYLPRFLYQYDATPIASYGGWTVLALPPNYPAVPYGPD